MRGNLNDGIVSVIIEEGSKKPIALNQKSFFGKLEGDILELSLIEACYLMEKGRLNIFENDKKCEFNYILDLIKEKDSYGNYIVYRDLKDRGYIIRTGFKYGAEFRLYDRGSQPGQGHSEYLVKIFFENDNIPAMNFASYVRVSHGVNKNFLMAIVDDDLDITYYDVEWTRP
ncbi:tRNA-intron lyase [Methanobrevibacter sp. DSM 116169]|uniref:tRNA-intron lyase n=1 Tax=Methanobrevibacter sp. DSM 116169 TaxID=3242727 RepID=UPI0038FC8231